MNYVAHSVVAEAVYPEANDFFLYGSMLPDFAGMAKTRLVRPIEDKDIKGGVDIHYLTDRIFDQNEIFSSIKSKFFKIHQEYLPRGAARACADPGSEILLDGFALTIPGVAESFERVMTTTFKSNPWLGRLVIDSLSLEDLNRRITGYGAPWIYQDPEFAAISIQRRLKDRHRLSFHEDLIPKVADTFELQQQEIGKMANLLITQTVESINILNSQEAIVN